MFGRKQDGKTLVADRHSAFRTLAEKAGFLLRLCRAHILAGSKDLAKHFGKDGKFVHKRLKQIFANAKDFAGEGNEEIVQQFKGEILELTKRHYSPLTVWKFVKALANRDIDSLFRFITEGDTDPTNNISERELRTLVIMRKISLGSGSPRGAHATAMLMSIIQTLRMGKKNSLEGLQQIVSNQAQS